MEYYPWHPKVFLACINVKKLALSLTPLKIIDFAALPLIWLVEKLNIVMPSYSQSSEVKNDKRESTDIITRNIFYYNMFHFVCNGILLIGSNIP